MDLSARMRERLTRKDSFIVLLSFIWTGGLSEGWGGGGGSGEREWASQLGEIKVSLTFSTPTTPAESPPVSPPFLPPSLRSYSSPAVNQ